MNTLISLVAAIFLIKQALGKQNAVIMVLCRNEELKEIDSAIKNFEEKFNSKFNYPYVFLNDKDFTDAFKETIKSRTRNNVVFGKVESKDWEMPKSIDKKRANKAWSEMKAKNVPYADLESYHNMCRFFSRAFYNHPLLRDYEFFWRIEPGVKFHCEIEEDPFDQMKEMNKKYGFVIVIHEIMGSISTLMKTTVEHAKLHYSDIKKNKEQMRFMFDNGKYNGCHFWSNFEIASFEFFRSREYSAYVDALEEAGGFYYERWGDAPVHSLAAAMLLGKSEIHFFEKIGYTHGGITHCPVNGKNCDCSPKNSIDFNGYSCLRRYLNDQSKKKHS